MRGSLTGFTRSNPAATHQRQARPASPEAKLHRLLAAHRSLTQTSVCLTAPMRTLKLLDQNPGRRDLNRNQLDLKSISVLVRRMIPQSSARDARIAAVRSPRRSLTGSTLCPRSAHSGPGGRGRERRYVQRPPYPTGGVGPAALGKTDPGLLGKMSPLRLQDLAHDSAQHESWSAVPMPQ